VRQGIIFGIVWTVLGVGELLLVVVGQLQLWGLLFGALCLALGGTYLVTAFALRRRERMAPARMI
jgi:hypothetical protein